MSDRNVTPNATSSSRDRLPTRSRPGTSRTVWVEIDEAELDEVRKALSSRAGYCSHAADLVSADELESERLLGLAKISRAVLARLPDAAAMRRRYP